MPLITKKELLEYANTKLQRKLTSLNFNYTKILYDFVLENSETVFQEISEELKTKARRRENSLSYEIKNIPEIFDKCKAYIRDIIFENIKFVAKNSKISVNVEECDCDLIAEATAVPENADESPETATVRIRFSRREIVNHIQSCISKSGYACAIIGNVLHISWED